MSELSEKAAENAKEHIEIEKDSLGEYLDYCFRCAVEIKMEQKDQNPDSFNGLGSTAGDVFESYFEEVMDEFFPELNIEHQKPIPEACMGGQAAADSAIVDETGDTILAVIESKGSPRQYKKVDGEVVYEPSGNPAMERSDTVKKAICQAYQVKKGLSNTKFFIVTNHIVKNGSTSACVLEKAEGDILDELVDATKYSDLETMVEMIED